MNLLLPHFCRCVATVIVVTTVALRSEARADDIEFNRDIRPILSANCLDCHGFDAKTRKADLRLDTFEGAIADHNGSVAIKPGDPSSSELIARIDSEDPEVIMPPPETKKSLKPAEKELLRRWIEQGAKYQKHWAFEPPVAHNVPSTKDTSWVRNPIDAFVLQKLEQNQIKPQREADRETLIRRVAFTLTGLPPKIDDVDAFLTDTSSDAYEKMVDRYLASPRYGEEQARYWLDVARYADTHGLHLDNEREMWVYRDWVIASFNQNLPFDQFTTWQLAGDLLPNPTLEQKVATGFNRCNVTTSEGGAIADEWLYRYAVDRTSTAMQTWMGLTGGCAVCHDHKYDPVTTKDFYSMYAFFYSTTDPAMDGNIRNTNPFIKVPSAEQKIALEKAQSIEASARKALEDAVAGLDYAEPTGLDEMKEVQDVVFDDSFPLGSRSRNTSRDDAVWPLNPDFGTKSGRRVLQLAYGGDYDLTLDLALLPVMTRADGRLEFWLRIDPYAPPAGLALRFDDGKNHQVTWGDKSKVGGKAQLEMGPIPKGGEWVRVEIPFDKLGCEPDAHIKSITFALDKGKVFVDDMKVVGKSAPSKDPRSSFNQWWVVSKGGNPSAIDGDIRKLLVDGPKDDAPADQKDKLLRFWLKNVQRPSESPVKELKDSFITASEDVIAISDSIPGTFIFTDLEKPRDAFVMLRGQYDKPGDKVEPAVPSEFPPLVDENGQAISGRRANRLDLARWFLSKQNPLTARVTMNRLWQQVFGTGLVKTSDDFGTRGDLPSHPELLDWLAIHFRDNGWNVKQMYRLMLNSASFRQHSAIGEERYQKDPENRLLAHGPRFRLDAEQLRDNALFVSGLMDLSMGGKGVLTYQPDDIWEPVGYENSNTRFYMQDHGASLYRRSVYCFLKRTAPPPFMSNFDGPNREQFCTRRERSNTPLQALQLMNDIQHFEAARGLAERTIAEGGNSVDQRIDFLFRTVLARHPESDEMRLVQEAFEEQLRLFKENPDAAAKAVRTGESKPGEIAPPAETAAWAMIANLVLNLDEAVVRN